VVLVGGSSRTLSVRDAIRRALTVERVVEKKGKKNDNSNNEKITNIPIHNGNDNIKSLHNHDNNNDDNNNNNDNNDNDNDKNINNIDPNNDTLEFCTSVDPDQVYILNMYMYMNISI
jgi:hypothetical protein